jgi:hypothetical protein
MDREIELSCDGNRIPMNRFTREIISNVLLAMVRTLKGVDTDAEITLRLGPLKK